MFTREILKNRAKAVLSRKYLKLLIAAVLLFWLSSTLPGKVLNVNYSVNVDSWPGWQTANELTVFNQAYPDLQRTIGYLAPIALLWMIFLVLAGLAVRFLFLRPLTAAMRNFFKRASFDEESADSVLDLFSDWRRLMRYASTLFLADIHIFLYTLLLIVPGIVRSYGYRFVPYLLEDEPDLSPREILCLSREMTQGMKLDIFVLDLSFIPWYLPGYLTLHLTDYFVRPYIYQTNAELYQEVRNQFIGGIHEY